MEFGLDERRAIALDQLGRRQGAVELGELRLVVEQLQMAGRAGHEQEQDPLGLGRIMRRPRSHGIEGQGPGRVDVGRVSLLLQQLAQRHGTEPDAALFEEPSPGDLAGVGMSIDMILTVHGVVSPLAGGSVVSFAALGQDGRGPGRVRPP